MGIDPNAFTGIVQVDVLGGLVDALDYATHTFFATLPIAFGAWVTWRGSDAALRWVKRMERRNLAQIESQRRQARPNE